MECLTTSATSLRLSLNLFSLVTHTLKIVYENSTKEEHKLTSLLSQKFSFSLCSQKEIIIMLALRSQIIKHLASMQTDEKLISIRREWSSVLFNCRNWKRPSPKTCFHWTRCFILSADLQIRNPYRFEESLTHSNSQSNFHLSWVISNFRFLLKFTNSST